MEWLIGYGIGAAVMLVACGFAIGDEPSFERLCGAILVSVFWPLVLPLWIGAIIRTCML